MRSFEFETKIIRDTKIPNGELPIIILHWLHEHYYGGSVTVVGLRDYLEPRLRSSMHSHDAVQVWIKKAHQWMKVIERQKPGRTSVLLAEYFGVEIAA